MSRYITVYKKEGSTIVAEDAVLSLSQDTIKIVSALLSKYPVRWGLAFLFTKFSVPSIS